MYGCHNIPIRQVGQREWKRTLSEAVRSRLCGCRPRYVSARPPRNVSKPVSRRQYVMSIGFAHGCHGSRTDGLRRLLHRNNGSSRRNRAQVDIVLVELAKVRRCEHGLAAHEHCGFRASLHRCYWTGRWTTIGDAYRHSPQTNLKTTSPAGMDGLILLLFSRGETCPRS